MAYDSSYESGCRPFQADTKRGYWANHNDFIYAGLGLAFRLDILSMTWFMVMELYRVAFIPAYLISLALYIVPFIIIQSFMGQFSSSGFISAFRLSPLFKGIGYVTLALNICVLSYYSLYAVIPLVYIFASMQPTLPWSCDGFKKWSYNLNLTKSEENNLCKITFSNTTERHDTIRHIPSVLYFKTLYKDLSLWDYHRVEFSMSWQLVLCVILVWTIVAVIIYKYFNTEKFGLLIRYAIWTLIALLVLFIVRFSFIPGAGSVYRRLFVPSWNTLWAGIYMVPLYGMQVFGPGWGLFITLASFNKFKTNVIKSSWLIGLGQFFIIASLFLLTNLTEHYFSEVVNYKYLTKVEYIWTLYLSSGSVMANMELANFWCILFFIMLFLGSMTLIITQLYSILVTIFDEFISLRERKLECCMGLIAIMAFCSLYFTSNHGFTYFTALVVDATITQISINLLLILIVLWIYGRVRFQRDMEFMTKQRISTFQIYLLRFVAPLGMVLVLWGAFIFSRSEHRFSTIFIELMDLILIVIPWLCIPGYAIYCMLQTSGSLKSRFLRCCRPTDWYPAKADERQNYEEAIQNLDVTHTL